MPEYREMDDTKLEDFKASVEIIRESVGIQVSIAEDVIEKLGKRSWDLTIIAEEAEVIDQKAYSEPAMNEALMNRLENITMEISALKKHLKNVLR